MKTSRVVFAFGLWVLLFGLWFFSTLVLPMGHMFHGLLYGFCAGFTAGSIVRAVVKGLDQTCQEDTSEE